jgi:hypothetical protein
MSKALLHDSGRSGKIGWARQAIAHGYAAGFVVSPWETPPQTQPRRPSAHDIAEGVRDEGGRVLFDPMSYAVFLPGTDTLDYYSQWDLWPLGVSKDTPSLVRHMERVVEIQTDHGLPIVLPTIALDTPTSADALAALTIVREARERFGDVELYISMVGSSAFWASGPDLDALVGELAQLRPHGWIMSCIRATSGYPWDNIDANEIAGLCRTTHSASQRSVVIVGHSDLAGLPMVAVGAAFIGSGWDLKQRVLSAELFRSSPGIRRQSLRVTHEGLHGSLKQQEAERLRAGDSTLSNTLVPGPLPIGFNGHWQHHMGVLSRLADSVGQPGSRAVRVSDLRARFERAKDAFAAAAPHARPLEADSIRWIDPLLDGLNLYAAQEGL